jgi:CheY-like chemotaxis protein
MTTATHTPLTYSPPALETTAAGHALPPPAGLRILCVDDNEDAADSLGTLLELVCCEVSVAHGAAEALEHVDEFCPQVCILDITLNETGWDGFKLAETLRKKPWGEDALFVALTALGDYRSLEWIADAGFDLHFTKPIAPADLYAVLNDFAQRGRPQT